MTINRLLVRWAAGWTERTDATSIAGVGRKEGTLYLGALSSLPEVRTVADGQLALFARPRVQTDIGINPAGADDTPFLGVNIGDTVSVNGDAGHRVLALGVTRDPETGYPIYQPTLNDDIILDPDERAHRWLRKLTQGSLGGRSNAAQPPVPIALRRGYAQSGGTDCAEEVFTESFNKADGALGPDLTWVVWDFSGAITVVSNTVGIVVDPTDGALAWADADVGLGTGMYVEATVADVGYPIDNPVFSYWQFSLLLRWNGDSTGAGAKYYQANFAQKANSTTQSVVTTLTEAGTPTATADIDAIQIGDRVRAEITDADDELRIYVNGGLVLTGAMPSMTPAPTDGKGGVYLAWDDAHPTSEVRLDAFEVGTLC